MEFKEFVKTMKRMCDRAGGCDKCPLNALASEIVIYSCFQIVYYNPEKADEIVSKWGFEHPLTNAERIKEVFGLDISVDLSDNGDSTVRINGSSFRGNEKLKDWLEDRYVEM